jgi:O-antigen/teichoic acid export membrane protein
MAIARDSMALFQNSVLTFLYQRLDTFLAERFLGLHAVSMLGAAKQFPAILSRVTGALLVPLLPNLSGLIVSGELTTASRVLNRAVVLSAVIGYTAALGGAALAQPLIRLIASPDYVGAAPVLGWLMAAMSLAIQAGVMGQGLIALGRAASVTQVNTVLAAVSIALNCLLLPRFGILGAGYAALAAVLFSAAAQALLASRHGLRVAWRPLLTLQALFAGLYAGSVVLGGAWGLLIATALFPVLCVATGALPHGEVRALLQAVLPRR